MECASKVISSFNHREIIGNLNQTVYIFPLLKWKWRCLLFKHYNHPVGQKRDAAVQCEYKRRWYLRLFIQMSSFRKNVKNEFIFDKFITRQKALLILTSLDKKPWMTLCLWWTEKMSSGIIWKNPCCQKVRVAHVCSKWRQYISVRLDFKMQKHVAWFLVSQLQCLCYNHY